jgi:multicomponent Na+:H+ antiporter subunit G
VSWVDAVTVASTSLGAYFFLAGTLGLLRFPDVFSRLHAVTKADNLGLGLVAAGIALQSGSVLVAVKLAVVWLLVLLASAASCYLVARTMLHEQGDGHDA